MPQPSLLHRSPLSITLLSLIALTPAWSGAQGMPNDESLASAMEQARKRATQVFERLDGSAAPKAPAFNTLTPKTPEHRPDPSAVAERMRANAAAQPQETNHDLVVLVSFSMPRASLERLAKESAAHGAVLVFRGPKNGSLRETLKAFEPLAKLGANAVIHPPAFKAHGVNHVPVYLFGRPLASKCEETRCEDVLRVDGDVSIGYALERMARADHPLSVHAQARLDRLSGTGR